MSHELREGVRLKEFFWPEWPAVGLGDGPKDYKSLTVQMQPGQMGMVPWIVAEQNDGEIMLINVEQLAGVTLLREQDDET